MPCATPKVASTAALSPVPELSLQQRPLAGNELLLAPTVFPYPTSHVGSMPVPAVVATAEAVGKTGFRQLHERRYRVSSLCLIMTVMCVGVLMVGVGSFLPAFMIGCKEATYAANVVRQHTAASVVGTYTSIVTGVPQSFVPSSSSCGSAEDVVNDVGSSFCDERWANLTVSEPNVKLLQEFRNLPEFWDDAYVMFDMDGYSPAYIAAMQLHNSVMTNHRANVRRSFHQSGRYLVLDTISGAIVRHSWNQTVPADTVFLPQNVTDPLMKTALDQLVQEGPDGTLLSALAARNARHFKFFNGKRKVRALVRIIPVGQVGSTNLTLISVTLDYAFSFLMHRRVIYLYLATAHLVTLIILTAYYIASRIGISLNRLSLALQLSSNLQFNAFTHTIEHSHFTEVLWIQVLYLHLQKRLMLLKAALPGTLLVSLPEEADEGGAKGDNYDDSASANTETETRPPTVPTTPGMKPNVGNSSGGIEGGGERVTDEKEIAVSDVIPPLSAAQYEGLPTTTQRQLNDSGLYRNSSEGSGSSGSGGHRCTSSSLVTTQHSQHQHRDMQSSSPLQTPDDLTRISTRWRKAMQLNTKIFNEQVNVLSKCYCTVLVAVRRYTKGQVSHESWNTFVEVADVVAAEFNGCLEFLRPDRAVITFGAHMPMPMHASRGCQCALAMWQRLPPRDRNEIDVLVDSNEFFVGTFGARRGRKGRAVSGVMHMLELVAFISTRPTGVVMATQSAVTHLPDHCSIPVIAVRVQEDPLPVFLCELRDVTEGADITPLSVCAKRFRAAFHYRCQGWYSAALRIYKKIGPEDATAMRLMHRCAVHIEAGDTKPDICECPEKKMVLYDCHEKLTGAGAFVRAMNTYIEQLDKDGSLYKPGRVAPFDAAALMFPRPAAVPVHGAEDAEKPEMMPVRMSTTSKRGGGACLQSPVGCLSNLAVVGGSGAGATMRSGTIASSVQSLPSRASECATATPKGSPIVRQGSLHVTTMSSVVSTEAPCSSTSLPSVGKSGGSSPYLRSFQHRRSDSPVNVASSGSKGAHSGSAATSAAAEEEGESAALFEWIDVPSSDSSSDTIEVGEENAPEMQYSIPIDSDSVPLVFVDDNGCRWTRSVQALSSGAYGSVYLGMSEDGVQVAIKCISRRRRDIREADLKAEMRMVSQLSHPNIAQHISCSVMPSHVAIIMEYVPGGSLHAAVQNFGYLDATVARRFLVGVLRGLEYLHSRGIVHCDVKPHNMLFGMDGVCKLSDFGSMVLDASDGNRSFTEDITLRGTPLYMAPEVARGERCTPQSDVFSLGISLLCMILGRLPWKWSPAMAEEKDADALQSLLHNDARFVQSLGRGEVVPDIPESLGGEVYNFVKACCNEDPLKRPSAQELLSFPFIL